MAKIKETYYPGQIINLENEGDRIIVHTEPFLKMRKRTILERKGSLYDVYRLKNKIVSAYLLDENLNKIPLFNSHGARVIDVNGHGCFEHRIFKLE